jgi:hypothetical protein
LHRSVWTGLRHYGYSDSLSFEFPHFPKCLVGAHDRLCLSSSALTFIASLQEKLKVRSGGVPLNNVKALIAMVPKGLIEMTQWNNFDDIASGEVVAVAGNGISLSGFVALFYLLLEANTGECAMVAQKIAFVLGYLHQTEPFVEVTKNIGYRRVLVVGSGDKSRSVVVRGVIVGATRFPDQVMRFVFPFGIGNVISSWFCFFAALSGVCSVLGRWTTCT